MRDIQLIEDPYDKKILVRIDTDVDVVDGKIEDDSRLQAAMPTLRFLASQGAILTLIGYRGRPNGQVDESLRLGEVAQALAHMLIPNNSAVPFSVESSSPVLARQYRLAVNVFLLENSRFDAREDKNDPTFAKELATGQDYFVNESFATAHRAVASSVGVANLLPSFAGLRLIDELAHLNILRENPERPFTLIVGGAKVEEKIGLLQELIPKVDHVLTGGVPANILLQASGVQVKQSTVDANFNAVATSLLGQYRSKLELPSDYVWDNDKISDIGPETITRYSQIISSSKTIFWAGSLGLAEDSRFEVGTRKIAEVLSNSSSVKIVGGGDTGAALRKFNLTSKMNFISTGGGAALEYLAGKSLPAIEALS